MTSNIHGTCGNLKYTNWKTLVSKIRIKEKEKKKKEEEEGFTEWLYILSTLVLSFPEIHIEEPFHHGWNWMSQVGTFFFLEKQSQVGT